MEYPQRGYYNPVPYASNGLPPPVPAAFASNGHAPRPAPAPYASNSHAPPAPAVFANNSHAPPPAPAVLATNGHAAAAAPTPKISSRNGFQFRLDWVQHPERARMCGFGDKDRRPLSAQPCIRLQISDHRSGKEIDYSLIQNPGRFLVTTDLLDPLTNQAANLVSHTAPTPTISTTSRDEFPIGASPVLTTEEYHQRLTNGYSNVQELQRHYSSFSQPPPTTLPNEPQVVRNLLGSTSTCGQLLHDTEGNTGIWFVFSDLSVRSEGQFRLKARAHDLMPKQSIFEPQGSIGAEDKAPCLATEYSNVFTVFSAKKFPGVPNSTELSRCFADQGVKLAIRKDGQKKRRRDDGDDGTKQQEQDSDEGEYNHRQDGPSGHYHHYQH